MAVKTLIFGILFLSLVYVVFPQGLRASFSNKKNGNANARFSGKPTGQVFSAKKSQRFTRPASFGNSRSRGSQIGQGFHRSQTTVTSAPFRRQPPSNGRNPFFGRRQQIVTDAPFTNRQQQTKSPWVNPNNQRSNNGPFQSNIIKQQHPLEQNAIQTQKNTRTNGFPTYRPDLRQFAQPFQFQREAITTQAPSVGGIGSFSPSGFNFGNANPSPSYKFEPSVQPQRPNQNSHPMADSLINITPPLSPSQQIRLAQGGGGGGGERMSGVEKNKPFMKIGVNNKIMNNPPPQLLANKVPLFQKPAKQNRNWRNNPNPRRQGGNRRINRQGKNLNWMKRKRGRRPEKPRQRPMHEMTTQPFNQQPFEPQAPFPGQPRFPFQSPPLFNNQGQGPTPPTMSPSMPPTMPPTAPTNPPMFPPTEPSPYAPTFPPATDPFYMPTSLNPTTRVTPSTPAPTRVPPPPKTTIDGIGLKCHHTAECSAGCCFDQSGTMLDTDTYGPNALKNGLATGTCQMKQPGLGETCDDLCACKTGFECYRRYKPNYKQGKIMAQNPLYEPPTPPSKPKRTCMRKAVSLAERWAFWKCYFDTACSGPLLK